MEFIKIENSKEIICDKCGEINVITNGQLSLLKKVSYVLVDKATGEIEYRCLKCKKVTKIS